MLQNAIKITVAPLNLRKELVKCVLKGIYWGFELFLTDSKKVSDASEKNHYIYPNINKWNLFLLHITKIN